jgi:glutathione synthase/RimK-type ligase-like ATP-grasp enzyme
VTTGVVIIGPPDDAQVCALAAAVRSHGGVARTYRMSTADAGEWEWASNRIVTPDGLCLTKARGIYLRSIPIQLPVHSEDWVRRTDESEWIRGAARFQRIHGFLKSVHLALSERGCEVINPLWGYAFHRSKPAADLTLASAGIRVPRGIATSSPAMVKEFMEQVGRVVYKPVAGGGRCRELDPARLADHKVALAAAPCYFQELIPGENLRIYTLGDVVLAAFIIESDDIDYRERETGVRLVTASPEAAATAIRAAGELGLTFAGSDIKLLPDGSHVVLDVNPSPMFAGLDALADGRIADRLALRLMGTLR